MKQESDSTKMRSLPRLWWIIWGATLLLSAVTPYLHHRWKIAEIIEPLRYPWGLLPAHWLILRWFGELAWYLLIAIAVAGVIAGFRPNLGRKLIVLSLILSLAFTVGYASYCGSLITGFIASQTKQIKAAEEKYSKEEIETNPDQKAEPDE